MPGNRRPLMLSNNFFARRPFLLRILPVACCLGVVIAGCNNDSSAECQYNSDCAMGQFCNTGTCQVEKQTPSDSSPFSTGSDIDTGVETEDSPYPDSSTAVTGDTADTTATDSSPGAVIGCSRNADCDDHNPCTQDYCDFSAKPYHCSATALPEGALCDDQNPCNGRDICQHTECVHIDPPCQTSIPPGGCIAYVGACNPGAAEICTYTTESAANGTLCTTTDACFQGVCQEGECSNVANPCSENDLPCVTGACVAGGKMPGEYDCETLPLTEGQFCRVSSAENPCAATPSNPNYADGTCHQTASGPMCILGDARICYDATLPNICSAEVCSPADGSCQEVPATDVSIAADCNSTLTIPATRFVTREYASYPPPCDPINAQGRELAVTLNITTATNVTAEVISEDEQNISLHHLTDMCNPSSCVSNAYQSLTMIGMLPSDAIIVEAGLGDPPKSLQLVITCN